MHHHSALRITRRSLDAEARLPRVSLRVVDENRPRTRDDCTGGERPCPWISCRHHLAIEVQRSGSISINPLLLEDAINGDDFDLNRLPETCALDVADRGETTEIDIAKLVGTTFQRVWQIEKRGLKLAKKKSGKKGYAEFVALMEEWNDSPGSSK